MKPTIPDHSTTACEDHAIRLALLEQSMEGIKGQLKAINSNISRLVWLLVGALLMAVLKLIVVGS